MNIDYIALSIPVFFLLIGIELLYGLVKHVKLYRLNDSITNISLGIGQQITGIFMKSALFFGYLWLYDNHRLMTIPATFLTWTLLFLGVDFFYYWFHRMSHEINALWAAHIVHHQSEDYNLSVALRQSWFQSAFSWVFYLPLAIAGFDPVMFLTISSFNTLYQFWIHTRVIGKMGPFEYVFNTPSHHRVHHGTDAKYIDKNHGGTLIIWDRLFGTFCEEEMEPHYGITTPLKSWNPWWANFHYWNDLFRSAAAVKGLRSLLNVFLKSPDWLASQQTSNVKPVMSQQYRKFDVHPSPAMNIYILVHFTFILTIATLVIFGFSGMAWFQSLPVSAFIIFSLTVFGYLFENRTYATRMELLRLMVAIPVALTFMKHDSFYLIMPVTLVITVLSIIVLQLLLEYFNRIKTIKIE